MQNFRVHGKKPQVIDLEESFKARFNTYKDTYLNNDVLSQAHDPGSIEPVVNNDKTLKVSLNFRPEGDIFALNKLVVYKPEQQSFVAKREDYIEDAAKGFIDTMYALRNPNNNQDILTWLSNARNMIVRYVPIGTIELARYMRVLMSSQSFVQNRVPRNPENYVDFVIHDPTFPYKKKTDSKTFINQFKEYVKGYYNGRLGGFSNDEDRRWKATPRFAICHPDHNFHDFFNLDIPSYYHRLGNAHLLNSRGMPVIPRDVWNWWQNNIFLPNPNFERPERPKIPSGRQIADGSGSLRANLFTTFFPDSPYNLFQQIFTELRTWSLETFEEFILANIIHIVEGYTPIIVEGNTQKELVIKYDEPNGYGYTDYILPLTDRGEPYINSIRGHARRLSNASEFQLPSENEPVLLNGMKVLFDKAAPVYPVNLTPKDKIPPKV